MHRNSVSPTAAQNISNSILIFSFIKSLKKNQKKIFFQHFSVLKIFDWFEFFKNFLNPELLLYLCPRNKPWFLPTLLPILIKPQLLYRDPIKARKLSHFTALILLNSVKNLLWSMPPKVHFHKRREKYVLYFPHFIFLLRSEFGRACLFSALAYLLYFSKFSISNLSLSHPQPHK